METLKGYLICTAFGDRWVSGSLFYPSNLVRDGDDLDIRRCKDWKL